LVNLAPEDIEQVAWSTLLSAIPKSKHIFSAPFSKQQGWLFKMPGSVLLNYAMTNNGNHCFFFALSHAVQ
jgi:hypothetical protein